MVTLRGAVRRSIRGHPGLTYNIHIIARAPIYRVPLTGNRQTHAVWPPVYRNRPLYDKDCTESDMQPSAFITRSNITWYCSHHCRNWGRISIRGWTHEGTPYLALTGELCGVFREYFGENWQRYTGTAPKHGLIIQWNAYIKTKNRTSVVPHVKTAKHGESVPL